VVHRYSCGLRIFRIRILEHPIFKDKELVGPPIFFVKLYVYPPIFSTAVLSEVGTGTREEGYQLAELSRSKPGGAPEEFSKSLSRPVDETLRDLFCERLA
jgi:hypothetical protein